MSFCKTKDFVPMKTGDYIGFFSSSKHLYCCKDFLKSDFIQGLPVYHSECLIIPPWSIGYPKISVWSKQAKIGGSADFLGV